MVRRENARLITAFVSLCAWNLAYETSFASRCPTFDRDAFDAKNRLGRERDTLLES